VDEDAVVPLANPLSEKYAVMRPSLLPGLLDSVGHNRRRERRDVQLFELGARMSVVTGETRGIACAWTGAAEPEHWNIPSRPVTFYDMKGVVEAMLAALGVRATFKAASHPALMHGRAAEVRATLPTGTGQAVGVLGQLSSAVAEAHGLPAHDDVLVAELDLDALAPLVNLGEDVRVTALPRHPSVIRDLSIVVPVSEPAEALRDTIHRAAPPTLERLYEFARYEGKGIPEGQLSLSFRLVFRAADRTLTDTEVQDAADHVLDALSAAHGARLR
jgi:phenylalanyl-tRNA synthetase beta chain